MHDRKLLTISAAAITAGVSRRTIYNWLGQGKVEWCRTPAGGVRIFADTLFLSPGEKQRSFAPLDHVGAVVREREREREEEVVRLPSRHTSSWSSRIRAGHS